MIEKRWVRTIVIFVATGILLIAQDFLREDKPPKIEPPRAITERVTGQTDTRYVLVGTVESVIDGDTLNLRTEDAGVQRVRLASIDAPERSTSAERPGQPFGDEARAFLDKRVKNATLTLTCYEKDTYERNICDVPDTSAADSTVNRALVAEGLAWANMEAKGRFLRDQAMTDLQEQAKARKVGLWSQAAEPVAPWQWRYQCWRNGQCG